jgi:branched-chain amino acid transport system ATP-binding protein
VSALAAAAPSGTPEVDADVLLRLDDVHTYYGQIHALQGVSLEVRRGEIVTLIGANGAGKTTTLKTISGLLHPRGTVTFDGQTSRRRQPTSRPPIGHSPEGCHLPGHRAGELQMAASPSRTSLGPSGPRPRTFPRLKERIGQRGGSLSGGEQQMLAIGRALMARPRVLLLDEPSLGLSPILVQQIFAIIREINESGTTILLVEQNALQALNVAHRGYVLQTGGVVLSGPSGELSENPTVRKAYLGEI